MKDFIIIDDVESPPLTEEQREKLREWYHATIENENLIVHTSFYGNNSITTIMPKKK